MKKLLIIIAAAVLAAACSSGDKYSVKGTVTGDSDKLVNGTAYLFNRDADNPVRDTVAVVNGKFEFTGTVSSPEPFIITIDGVPGMLSIFLENAKFTVTASEDDLAGAAVTGGAAQTMMNRYNDGADAIAGKYAIEDVVKTLRSADATEEEKEAASKTYEEYQAEVDAMKDALLAEAPLSHFALFFLATRGDRIGRLAVCIILFCLEMSVCAFLDSYVERINGEALYDVLVRMARPMVFGPLWLLLRRVSAAPPPPNVT